MIELKNICKIYNSENSVGIGLQNVNLSFKVGEFVAITGSSGSGKTTLLNVISGMDTYEEGELIIAGKSMNDFTMEQIEDYRRANVAFIFQNYQLIDSYTVLENVMIELIFKGYEKKQARDKAIEILKKVGMEKRLKNRATKLSGGEKQRVVIARALASDAKILICDEPTGNLDSKNSVEIMRLLKENSKDKLVLFVTHDESLIDGNANRIVRVKDGRIDEDRHLEIVEETTYEVAESKPNGFGIQVYIALKNILRTPKKTMFTMTVFLILVAVIIFSVAYIPLDVVATSSYDISYNMYTNEDENRIVVYNNNTFDGDYNVDVTRIDRDYFLDEKYRIGVSENGLNNILESPSYIKICNEDLELVAGRYPVAQDEIVLIVNRTLGVEFLQNRLNLNAKIGLYSALNYFDLRFKIVGYCYSSEEPVDPAVVIPALNKKGTNILMSAAGTKYFFDYIDSTIVGQVPVSSYLLDFNVKHNNKSYDIFYDIMYELDENGSPIKDVIYISNEFVNEDLKIFVGEKELDLSKYKIVYEYFMSSNYVVRMSSFVAYNIVKENPYRCSFYVNSDKIDGVISILQNNASLGVYPLKNASKTMATYDILSVLEKAFYFVFLFVEVVVSLFVASLITSFVLGTKKKELGVLRVIGLSEKDVLRVLNIELLVIMLFSILIDILLVVIVSLLPINLNLLFIFNDGWKLLFSIVVLLIMALAISFRWNKKMFKKTAREVLKVGESL